MGVLLTVRKPLLSILAYSTNACHVSVSGRMYQTKPYLEGQAAQSGFGIFLYKGMSEGRILFHDFLV